MTTDHDYCDPIVIKLRSTKKYDPKQNYSRVIQNFIEFLYFSENWKFWKNSEWAHEDMADLFWADLQK